MQVSTHFKQAATATLLTAGLLFAGTYLMGKYPFFLLLNGNGGSWLDELFKWWTYLGDGIIWVVAVVATFYYRRNKLLLVLLCLIISTLLSQGGKHLLFPDALRPSAVPVELPAIHTVSGVELHTSQSFPSGHTTTAFTIFLLACQLIPHRWTLLGGYLLAAGAGYSRIYLAQHFPSDVAAGMLVGIFTVSISIYIESKTKKSR
ncbi:MAG: phosphatase PAP2 family protein [Bacteroidota bacterium]|jgi:membrane-associated phospholipid phosphatase